MSGATVLVVDDEETIRDTLKMILEFENYSVVTANNGKEALDILKKGFRPCVILLDLMMPVMSGEEFLKKQKADQSLAEIPVVAVSAFGKEGASIGASAFVKKPVELDDLLAEVKRFCDEGAKGENQSKAARG